MSPSEAIRARTALEQVLEREGLGWLVARAGEDPAAGDDDRARLTALIDTTLATLTDSPALPSGFPAVGGLVAALQDLRALALS
jgi:hypothetical protein